MALTLETKKNDPKKLLIFWNEELYREVYKPIFYRFLCKLAPLNFNDFTTQFAALEEKIGKSYALYWLARTSLLSCTLETKLLSKGISPCATQKILDYCKERGYLNDSAQLKRLILKETKKGTSTKAIFYKLKAKGIDENMLRAHIPNSDTETLQTWIQKHGSKIDCDDPVAVRKLIAKLCRLGFAPELVFKAFDDIYES